MRWRADNRGGRHQQPLPRCGLGVCEAWYGLDASQNLKCHAAGRSHGRPLRHTAHGAVAAKRLYALPQSSTLPCPAGRSCRASRSLAQKLQAWTGRQAGGQADSRKSCRHRLMFLLLGGHGVCQAGLSYQGKVILRLLDSRPSPDLKSAQRISPGVRSLEGSAGTGSSASTWKVALLAPTPLPSRRQALGFLERPEAYLWRT